MKKFLFSGISFIFLIAALSLAIFANPPSSNTSATKDGQNITAVIDEVAVISDKTTNAKAIIENASTAANGIKSIGAARIAHLAANQKAINARQAKTSATEVANITEEASPATANYKTGAMESS
jgi:hypothetical protein